LRRRGAAEQPCHELAFVAALVEVDEQSRLSAVNRPCGQSLLV
jgi:hypothetical protein